MKIGAFARKHGIAIDSLRFYEELQLLVPDRQDNGYRDYTTLHDQQIKMIICLKSIGFSLQEIKTLVEFSQQPPSESCNILSNQLIDQKLYHLNQQITQLEYARTTLHEVKHYIENNNFVQNQQRIQHLVEQLYQLIKKTD